MNLRGFSKRRRCVTTKRSQSASVFADLVKRQFHAQAPNRVYVGDITYLPCKTVQICIAPQSLIYVRGNLQVSRLPITCASVLSSRLKSMPTPYAVGLMGLSSIPITAAFIPPQRLAHAAASWALLSLWALLAQARIM